MAGQKRDIDSSCQELNESTLKKNCSIPSNTEVNPLDILVQACEVVGSSKLKSQDVPSPIKKERLNHIGNGDANLSPPLATPPLSDQGDSGGEEGDDHTVTSLVIESNPDAYRLLLSNGVSIKKELEPNGVPDSDRSSHLATATHISVNSFGSLELQIEEYQLCRYSKYTGWHLQRGSGDMTMHIISRNVPFSSDGSYIVRCVLVRRNPGYRHYGVDSVCDRHKDSTDCINASHVLHPGSGAKNWFFDETGERKSICFDIPIETNTLQGMISLRCLCNDSCSTCDDPSFKKTESGRDLMLVITVESTQLNAIIARRSVEIWPKAIVREKDLLKPVRRLPKGGLAIQNKKKHSQLLQNMYLKENGVPSPPTSSSANSASSSPSPPLMLAHPLNGVSSKTVPVATKGIRPHSSHLGAAASASGGASAGNLHHVAAPHSTNGIAIPSPVASTNQSISSSSMVTVTRSGISLTGSSGAKLGGGESSLSNGHHIQNSKVTLGSSHHTVTTNGMVKGDNHSSISAAPSTTLTLNKLNSGTVSLNGAGGTANSPVVFKTVNGSSLTGLNCSEDAVKKVNILLQVEEKLPENLNDLLKIVVRNSVNHAVTLQLSKEEYLALCSKEFDSKTKQQPHQQLSPAALPATDLQIKEDA